MELAGGVGRGWGWIGGPAGSVKGHLGTEGCVVRGLRGHCGAGGDVHLCEGLQGLEPVGRIVVLKRFQTVARGCWDTCSTVGG